MIRSIALRQIAQMTNLMREQSRLYDVLASVGVKPIVLKGAAAEQYYKNPTLRTFGDINFLVRGREQFQKAVDTMIKDGYVYTEKESNGEKFSYDRETTRHIELLKNGIEVEIHARYTTQDKESNVILEKRLNETEPVTTYVRNDRFLCFPDLENGLIILHHINYHILQGGIGFRQIIDWACYAQAVMNDDFWEDHFASAAESVKLKEFAIYLTRMCEIYFGIAEHEFTKGASIKTCESLYDLIVKAGNFGNGVDEIEQKATRMVAKGGFTSTLKVYGNNWHKETGENVILVYFKLLIKAICICVTKLFTSSGPKRLINAVRNDRKKKRLFKDLNIGQIKS